MSTLNTLLEDQIQQVRLSDGELDVARLIELVSAVYDNNDADRVHTNHSISLMIDEIEAKNFALRENQERRFEAAIAHMSQGLSSFDKHQRLVTCNPAYLKLHNISSELAQPGTSFWDLLDEASKTGRVSIADPVERRRELTKVIERGDPRQFQTRLISGETFRFSHQPLPGGGWVTLQEDVTEQIRLQEEEAARIREVEQQHMRFHAAVNNMNHGLTMFDAKGKLVVCNETYRRMYDLPAGLARAGTDFWTIYDFRQERGSVSVEGKKRVRAILREQIANRKSSRATIELRDGRSVLISHQPTADGGWLSTHEDITEQSRSEEMLRYLARHDNLTGLANRAAFLETLGDTVSKVSAKQNYAVLCIDLNHFKHINETFGHAAGDIVLQAVAQRLRSVVGATGEIARLGADEFAVLLGPLDSADRASDVADRIIQELARPVLLDDDPASAEASVGIAIAPRDGNTGDLLLRNGNLALDRAKADPGTSYCFFEREMDLAHRRRQDIESGLRQAVVDGDLELHFQPLVELSTGRVSCCEALMRWTSPVLGTVAPDEFIGVAEETGQIREMGSWALRVACNAARKWPDHVRVAVNVSPTQFQGCELVNEVRCALETSGLAPERLELEITESLFLADDEHNLETLHALRKLGVRVALDDFGTGYSSLAYLLQFPFDKVKIDRSIVSSIADNKQASAVVKAIVELCADMQMDTVAEGIETDDQLHAVRQRGCTEVQGYIFSPPLPDTAICDLVSANAAGADDWRVAS